MPLWNAAEKRDAPSLWPLEGYWSPQNQHFALNWLDTPWTDYADRHVAMDFEGAVAGLITLAPKMTPRFEQFARDQPNPEVDPVAQPQTRRGFAVCCQVLDDDEVGDESFVCSGNNWSWTNFVEEQFNRTLRHHGQGYVPVLQLLPARTLELKNGGSTSIIRTKPVGWMRRPQDMIDFAASRGIIDASVPPYLASADPPAELAYAGAAPRQISAPVAQPKPPPAAAADTYARAKGGEPAAARKPPEPRFEIDDDIPF